MLTKPLHQILLAWLPDRYQKVMKELEHHANNPALKALDLVIENPTVRGLTQIELSDWIPTMVALTFKQHFEDGKLNASNDDEQILAGLFYSAEVTIADFIFKYKSEQYDAMTPRNFINEFVGISTRPLSDICPDTPVVCAETNAIHDIQIIKILESDDWLTIKEFKPLVFAKVSETTSRASKWEQGGVALKIISISVVQDVVMLSSLAEQLYEADRDFLKAIDEYLSDEIVDERESIRREILADIRDRLHKYKIDLNQEELLHLPSVADEIATLFTTDPKSIIEVFGPDILCVEWSDDITCC